MLYIKELPKREKLSKDYSLTEAEEQSRASRIREIQKVLSGEDDRKILIIGPCSADRQDSVLDYVIRLKGIEKRISDKFIVIPRIYTSKPRTTGEGYKGILHNPDADEQEDLLRGLYASRMLHLSVIRETGLFAADEMLYPEEMYYISDLLCYMAVGARSVEDQGHRMLASDDSLPVGLKNPTGGSKISLLQSVRAAQKGHRMIYRGWEVETLGNPYAHAILRGFINKSGRNYQNYHYEDIVELHDMMYTNNLSNVSVIIDCNHSNSDKKYEEQVRIAKEVFGFFRENEDVRSFVKGLMIESYIEDGSQIPGQGIYGKSITDPCLGWKKTEKLLYELYEMI
ncbi:MAG: 3-deoxy-7-phosphoheptulonate synthase [Lachnospiraceae bacterium]|nr:3-deoxy-7-phosphoheptulonate synthase [Lachnospiraceae bacterium]